MQATLKKRQQREQEDFLKNFLLLQTHQAITSRVALVDRLNPQKQTVKKVF